MMEQPDFQQMRYAMVKKQIENRGVSDPLVLKAMRKVPRHEFVPQDIINRSYDDCPLPIGENQTLSQPYMVALMTQLLSLKKDDTVLEVGTGSGYQTAILAELCSEIWTIERIEQLYESAKEKLGRMKYTNVHYQCGDGTNNLDGHSALYNAIMVTAAAPEKPDYLFTFLAEGGRCVVPVGNRAHQKLMLYQLSKGRISEETVCGCVFVPLIGSYGFSMN